VVEGSLTIAIVAFGGAAPSTVVAVLDQLPIPSSHQVCLVAFTGSYTPGQVELPFGPVPAPGAGRFAIAVVTIPKATLLGTFVVQREPLSFTREHVGF
jgi:hypothetical protein